MRADASAVSACHAYRGWRMREHVTYAGIGSRRTPPEILILLQQTAEWLSEQGWVLRSGHAPGADQACEAGAGHRAEVYLPWPSFEKSEPLDADYIHDTPDPAALCMAEQYHPSWQALKQGARKLHARNCHQILGPSLTDPVSFVLCWTPDGSLDGRGGNTGGTGQALRIAADHGIRVYNVARDDHRERVARCIST